MTGRPAAETDATAGSADEELEQIRDHLEAVRNEYRDLKRELFEVRTMLESDEFDP